MFQKYSNIKNKIKIYSYLNYLDIKYYNSIYEILLSRIFRGWDINERKMKFLINKSITNNSIMPISKLFGNNSQVSIRKIQTMTFKSLADEKEFSGILSLNISQIMIEEFRRFLYYESPITIKTIKKSFENNKKNKMYKKRKTMLTLGEGKTKISNLYINNLKEKKRNIFDKKDSRRSVILDLRTINHFKTQNSKKEIKKGLKDKKVTFSETKPFNKMFNDYSLRNDCKSSKNETINNYQKDLDEKKMKLRLFSKNLENYNTLKNKRNFDRCSLNLKDNSLGIYFRKFFIDGRDRANLNLRLKNDSIIIKEAGYDMLTKEASLIKTKEIEKDLPIIKRFEKLILLMEHNNSSLFEKLLDEEEEREKEEKIQQINEENFDEEDINLNFNQILNIKHHSTGNTLLIYATVFGNKRIVEKLLIKGSNPNIKNKFGNTALHIAYKNNNYLLIDLLLQYKANENIKNNDGLIPLQMLYFDEI